MQNFGFKPIDEFTFDDCVTRIEHDRADGVETDAQLRERHAVLLQALRQKDDNLFRQATTLLALKRYLASQPLDSTATKYSPRHVDDAKERIAAINAEERRRSRRIAIIVVSAIAVAVALLCWVNYKPVKSLDPLLDGEPISKYGGSIRVGIITNVFPGLIDMHIDEGADWLEAIGDDGHYTFKAGPNTGAARTAKITFSAPNLFFGKCTSREYRSITLTQESGKPTKISTERSAIDFDKYGSAKGSASLIVTTDGVLKSETSAASWCRVVLSSLGDGRYKCQVSADRNPEGHRSGSITLKGGNITKSIAVRQESGLASHIDLDISKLSAPPTQTSRLVSVRTDGTSWHVASCPSWVRTVDLGGNSLKLIIDENSGAKRSGTVTVASNNSHKATIAVEQRTALASYIRAGQTSINADTYGLDKYISVDTDGKSWSVYSYSSWMTVTPNYEGRKIYVEIPSNSGKVKEGQITLASNNGHQATISVWQNGDPSNFTLGQSSIKFDTGSDYDYVSLSNNSKKSVSVDATHTWISPSITSSGNIKISVSSNSNGPRTGYVTARCGSETCRIEIKQRGWYNCYACGGHGKVRCSYPALWINGMHCVQEFVMNYYTGGGYYINKPCPWCGGSGGIDCNQCHGDGRYKSN